MILIDIVNHLEPAHPHPVLTHDKGQEPDLAALERALGRAQELADTPEPLRFKRAKRWPLQIAATTFYDDARAMYKILAPIALAVEVDTPWKSPLIINTRRRLDILSDYSIDLGPELFGETLLRVLAGRDARRIRLCPECFRLFVLLRQNQTACSEKCSSRRRVQKFLADPKNAGYYTRQAREARKHPQKRRWRKQP
jgi:hypothetical protein